MQINAYHQYSVPQDSNDPRLHHENSEVTATPSSTAPEEQEHGRNDGQMSQLMSQVRDNPAVQQYMHAMIRRAAKSSFDGNQEAAQAPAIVRQTADRLGINLPSELNLFSNQIQQAGQVPSQTQPYQQTAAQPNLMQHLAHVSTKA